MHKFGISLSHLSAMTLKLCNNVNVVCSYVEAGNFFHFLKKIDSTDDLGKESGIQNGHDMEGRESNEDHPYYHEMAMSQLV